MGPFLFHFLHVVAFLLRFSHYSFALTGGGVNSRQPSPFKKSAIWGAFLLPFLHVGDFLLRFSHYNYAPAEGGGKTWRSPLPEKLRKNIFLLYEEPFCYFFLHVFFFCYVVHYGGAFLLIFFYVGGFFVFMKGGGFLCLPPSY